MRETHKHQPCFGRARDLAQLAKRVSQRGVTFVMAPPRIGKTWLVRNLAFQWAAPRQWAVGYAESSAGKNDLLREVIADLYKRWLADAGKIEQAKSLLKRHGDELVAKVGPVVGRLIGKVAGLASADWVNAHRAIDEVFNALGRAETDLRTGGLTFEPITYEDAHALVRLVTDVTKRPVLLVMDAWERGETLAGDRGSIQKLLDNEDNWPPNFHLIVVIRDLPRHMEEVQFADECCRTYPSAEPYLLGPLLLDDLEEQDRLLLFLRHEVPAVPRAERDWVIKQCANPAVIEWWVRTKPDTLDRLRVEAGNAQNQLYLGLFELIEQIHTDSPLFNATIRLALLPEITSAQMWEPYKELFDEHECDRMVTELQSRRILDVDKANFPSFGHTTAYDAVRDFLVHKPVAASQIDVRPHVRAELKDLIAALAGRVRTIAANDRPYAAALATLG